MPQFRDADEALSFAIKKEEEAASFYEEQAEKMNQPAMRKVFLEFAGEEKIHRERLLAIKAGPAHLSLSQPKVINLRIADELQAAPPVGPYMSYVEMLVVAMLKEKEAYKLYTDLSETTEDAQLRAVFIALATEEARHKLRFEIEYDHEMKREN